MCGATKEKMSMRSIYIYIYIIFKVLLKQNALLPPSYSNLFILPCCQLITMNILIVVATHLDKINDLHPKLPMVLLATYHPLNNTPNLMPFHQHETPLALASSQIYVGFKQTIQGVSSMFQKLSFGIKY